jgi:hypothetical protein
MHENVTNPELLGGLDDARETSHRRQSLIRGTPSSIMPARGCSISVGDVGGMSFFGGRHNNSGSP